MTFDQKIIFQNIHNLFDFNFGFDFPFVKTIYLKLLKSKAKQ